MERFIVTFDTFHLVTYLIVIVSILGIFLTGYGKSNLKILIFIVIQRTSSTADVRV